MSVEPDVYPVAYCAPGQQFAAAFTLMFKGEQVARIEEHPWLEGSTDVIVISEQPDFAIPPVPVTTDAALEPHHWPYRIGGGQILPPGV